MSDASLRHRQPAMRRHAATPLSELLETECVCNVKSRVGTVGHHPDRSPVSREPEATVRSIRYRVQTRHPRDPPVITTKNSCQSSRTVGRTRETQQILRCNNGRFASGVVGRFNGLRHLKTRPLCPFLLCDLVVSERSRGDRVSPLVRSWDSGFSSVVTPTGDAHTEADETGESPGVSCLASSLELRSGTTPQQTC